MGLDAVELVIAVEESFGIRIGDAEAEKTATVGDLHRVVLSRLPPRSSSSCLGSHAFYRLRSELRQLFGAARSAVRPRAPLADLVPRTRRRQAWRTLSSRLSWRLPELRRAPALDLALGVAPLSLVPLAVIGGMTGLLPTATAWLLGLVAIPTLVALHYLTLPLAAHLPTGCATVGGLAREIVRLNFAVISRSRNAGSEAEAWETLRAIVVEQLGVPAHRVTAEARFVEDLGVD